MASDLILGLALQDLWWWIVIIFKVSVGLGAVIFVHELGHFLMAKACGVKVEKFMIGFDIGGYKIAWQRGETLYGIGILPLGGYVKMLGQDDDPAHIAEQMQKSQVDSQSSEAVPITGPNGETYYVDGRSYLAKSVPQRMAIISAGVVMNIIFAFIFAVVAYGMGVPYWPCIVSQTVPGSPAWQAGLQPGDEIVQIGERVEPTFLQLKGGVTLGDLEEGLPLVIRPAANPDELVKLNLTPVQKGGRLATVGIGPPTSLELDKEKPAYKNSSAGRAKLVEPSDLKGESKDLKGNDKIVAVGGVEVSDYRGYMAEMAKHVTQPVLVTVERSPPQEERGADRGAAEEKQRLTFEVQPNSANRFGLRLKMGPITAIREGSPAEVAGLKVGDVIERIDDKPLGEGSGIEVWDAESLPNYMYRAALAGRTVKISARRPNSKDTSEEITAELKPVVPSAFTAPGLDAPMGLEEIGAAYAIKNEVASIAPDSPAAALDVAPGDQLVTATLILPADKQGNTPPKVPLELGPDRSNWPLLLDLIQFVPDSTKVDFEVKREGEEKSRTLAIEPAAVANLYTAERGFILQPIQYMRKANSFGEAVRYGWDETADALLMVVRFLQKIGTQVPMSAFGGPITIAKAAGSAADEGISSLLIFLTMLSANLAVINFLPIPLLDGGHMVFLAYEGIRGRPAREKFVVAMHMAGFLLIVSLMLYVIALDLGFIPRNL